MAEDELRRKLPNWDFRMAETRAPSPLTVWTRRAFVCAFYLVGIFWALVWLLRQPMEIWKNPAGYFAAKKRASLPAILREPEVGQHGYLNLPNGIRIHYVAAGNEKNPLLLLLHGFPEFWFSWRNQIRHFSDRYRVVAVDLRGFGDSSKPTDEHAYELTKMAEDVKLIVEGLGRKSCVLAGHDWGGFIAWGVASKYPDLVDKLIVMNATHPTVFWKFLMKNPKQFLMSWYIFMFQLPLLPEFYIGHDDFVELEAFLTKPPTGMKPGSITAEELDAYKYTFSEPKSLTAAISFYRNFSRKRDSEPIRWQPVPCPVLVIWGAADAFLCSELALLSGQYTSGQFEVKYLDGISHWVQMEAPDEVNRTMDQFL
ncbi:Epoxide hydrolase 4 [Hypsibius exemplaris]|uniref:Epoxide hydrolase 4 n=1 Tax=Hypsibius exemplaris TaxID=2072580 RepID=A0A1W0X919_HYPEX|nr:Epoxide hydrolase 4 [Hypsibius exemplaris]